MKKWTVTIGIPAYNEEANIANLIHQLLRQKRRNFDLEQILILSDGSTDMTNKIVRIESSKNKIVKLIASRKRNGKVYQLNKLYKNNTSDILFNFDGDIKLKNNSVIAKTIDLIEKNSKSDVVAIHQIPVKPRDFIGRSIYAGYEFWDRARLSVPNSDHIQNLYGAATAYKKSFVKSFRFPKDITDDRGYLYIRAKMAGGFLYNKNTHISYMPVSTLHDFRKLADRSFDKNRIELVKYFGSSVNNLYHIPAKNKIIAIAETFLKEPIFCIGGILLNIYTRLLPLHDNLYNSHMWEISKSTKNLNYS